jgi:ankyrin repeat protein
LLYEAKLFVMEGYAVRQRFWAPLVLTLAVLGAGALGTIGWLFPRGAQLARDWPELVLAAREGRSGDIAAQVARGADPDRYDSGPNRWTPLLHAVHKNQLASVRALIAAGANVDRPAPNGLTPLMLAASQGEEEIVRELLAAGADPHAEQPGGETALTRAVLAGDERIIQAILQEDPDLQLGDTWEDRGARALAWVRGQDEMLVSFNRSGKGGAR